MKTLYTILELKVGAKIAGALVLTIFALGLIFGDWTEFAN